MTTPNGEGPKELADMPHLSDVQATDALLDRLAARTPTTDDVKDPIIADLVLLTGFADASPVPPPGIDRLIEVLDGRPLYMFDRGSAAATEADEPIQLDADQPAARMVDLTSPGAAEAGLNDDEDDAFAGVAARATGSEHGSAADDLSLIRSMRSARRPSTKAGWQGVVQQIALPAASVVALLALGGGVSAVVTGDPMSPVYGITQVASALPGIDNPSEKKLKSAKRDVRSAQAAVGNNNEQAREYLDRANSKVADVPADKQQELLAAISDVKTQVSVAAAADPSPTVAPSASPSPSVTSTPVETSEPTQAPVTDPPSTPAATTPAETSTVSPSADATVGDAGTDAGSDGG